MLSVPANQVKKISISVGFPKKYHSDEKMDDNEPKNKTQRATSLETVKLFYFSAVNFPRGILLYFFTMR